MKIIDLILWFLILYSIFTIWILYRNNKVCKFRLWLNDECYRWGERKKFNYSISESPYRWYFDKLPSYSKMLYSFKPLKVKYWMPQELNNRLFDEDLI